MKNIKKIIEEKKKNREKIILELGPGEKKIFTHAITIDIVNKQSVDFVYDLNLGFPFLEDNVIDEIYAYHFIEHIDDLENFMKEIYRILKPQGLFIGTVPHFSNPYFYSDYTHKNFFGLYTFAYFSNNSFFKRKIPTYYNNLNFSIIEIKLNFMSPFKGRNLLKKILNIFFNKAQYLKEIYEELFVYIFPCYEIFFKLKKDE